MAAIGGRHRYPAEFRRKLLDLLAAGNSVASVAHDPDLSDRMIYNWRRQIALMGAADRREHG
jgi:transposase